MNNAIWKISEGLIKLDISGIEIGSVLRTGTKMYLENGIARPASEDAETGYYLFKDTVISDGVTVELLVDRPALLS